MTKSVTMAIVRPNDHPRPRGGVRRRDLKGLSLVRDCLLEDRCLLAAVPGQVEFPAAPTNAFGKYDTVANLSDVISTVASSSPFAKTITITNSSDRVMFAFLEAENTHQAVAGPTADYTGTASYDPFDPLNHEYRGYVGTTDGADDYAGIPPHSSVTVTVPLAFWDSGRINISADGPDQFATYQAPDLNLVGTPAGAPFNYLNADTQAIFFGTITKSGDQSQLNFAPVYNSFVGGQPSTANWQSPVASGLFKAGQTYLVTGPGLGAETVTIDPGHPGYVNLPTSVPASATVGQYTFTIQTDPNTPSGSPAVISSTARYVQTGLPLTTQGSAGTNDGVVLWYHSLVGQQPNNLAPFQLTELTFRGTFYDATANPGTDFAALLDANDYAGAINDLADYDISYVDSVDLPVAMEAANASVGNTGTTAPFGWIGSGMTVEAFQDALEAFASSNTPGGGNTNGLGTYFGGQGYPTYLPLGTGEVKLPSGQNLFLQGPSSAGSVSDIHFVKTFPDGSVIDQPLLELTSGGTDPTTWAIGLNPNHPTQGDDLGLNNDDADAYTVENFLTKAGTTYDVTYTDPVSGKTVLAGVVSGLYFGPDGTTLYGVKLDRPAPEGLPTTTVFTFTRQQEDYAGGGIAGLWYSWAKYYADNVVSSPLANVAGTMNGSLLTLASPAPNLVPGMAVTSGAALPPGCVILSVSPDHRTIRLSTVATGVPTTFSFAAPSFASLVGYDPAATPLVNLSFTTAAEEAYALAFARSVYVAMSAWGVSVPSGTANAWSPLLTNIIGGNTGPAFLAHADTPVTTFLTDVTKSLQRGVPDFTSPLYADQALWYPDPALPAGGLSYNAFNLNPVVWFVHQKLGAIVYAFSLDDELGNVNAGGATDVRIDIGGLDGFAGLNQDQYSNTSNFGVVTSGAQATQARSSQVQATAPNLTDKLFPYDPNSKMPGTLVNGPGVAVGTSLEFLTPSLTLNNPLSAPSTAPTFSFFGPPIFTGTVLGPNQATDTIVLGAKGADGQFPAQALAAYNSLLRMGPLANIEVNGEGIAPPQLGGTNPPVTIQSLTMGADAITLQLSAALNPALVSQPGGSYGYTFGDAALGLLLDPGFEWADVSALSGQFNHGAQLTENTRDWTFTDSPTQPKSWFAGIAFDDTSTYTDKNPKAPQGLQVGFIQGDSRISQAFVAGAGVYTLMLSAAQSGNNLSPQTLQVLVDGVTAGTVSPSGTGYQSFTIQFGLKDTGQHTITFQGMQASANTVLIDAISASPETGLAAPEPVVLEAIPNPSVVVGSTVTFTAHASGLSSPLIYRLAPGAPGGATIDPDTGVFTWTPTAPGVYAVTVEVNDHSLPALGDEQVVTITVGKATTRAVAVSSLPAPTYGQSLYFGAAVAAAPGLGDPSGTIQFVLDGSDFGSPVAMSGGFAPSPSLATLGAGVHHVAAVYSGDADYAAVVSPVLTTTVARAPLAIVASSGSKAYGQPNPLLTATYTGFVNGETAASLTTPVLLWTAAGPSSPTGSYAIAAWGASSPDYAITLVPGVLTVTAPPAGVSAATQGWTAIATTLYQEVLGRTPDAAGLNFWVRTLDRGASPTAVAPSIWDSPEHIQLLATRRAPRIAFATALTDARTAGQFAFKLTSSFPRGPLTVAKAKNA